MGATAALSMQAASLIGNVGVQRQQANHAITQGDYEAGLDANRATDALARGQQSVSRLQTNTRGLIGAQRANAAASGVDTGSGSAADVQADTARLSALDEQTIKTNAAREAWGYQTEGALTKAAAQNTAQAYRDEANSTILTGSANLYSAYQKSGISFGKAGGSRSTSPVGTAVKSSSYNGRMS